MATEEFKPGDKVSWNSAQGKVFGSVKKKLTAPTDIKTHHVAASPDNPQLLVQSAGRKKMAAHKPEALKRVQAKWVPTTPSRLRMNSRSQSTCHLLQIKTQEPAMPQTVKVKGPASYFPSIEKTYGKPISHWMGILKLSGELKHMQLVSLLKTEHQMGHGHANALVAHFLAQK